VSTETQTSAQSSQRAAAGKPPREDDPRYPLTRLEALLDPGP
jgi:hypothetical protein